MAQNLSTEDLNAISSSFMNDSQIFTKRLNQISKKLDQEVEPFKPVSKDHTRTNRVGVNLEMLESI